MCSIFAEGKQRYLLFLRRRINLIFAYYPIDLIRSYVIFYATSN